MNNKVKLKLALLLVNVAMSGPGIQEKHITNVEFAEVPKGDMGPALLLGLPRSLQPNFPEDLSVRVTNDVVTLPGSGTTRIAVRGDYCFASAGPLIGIAPKDQLAQLVQSIARHTTNANYTLAESLVEKMPKDQRSSFFNSCNKFVAQAISECGERAGLIRMAKNVSKNATHYMSLKLGCNLELKFAIWQPADNTEPCTISVSLFSDSYEAMRFKDEDSKETGFFLQKLDFFASELAKYKSLNPSLEKVIKHLDVFKTVIAANVINCSISPESEGDIEITCYGATFLVPKSHAPHAFRDSLEDLISTLKNRTLKISGLRLKRKLSEEELKTFRVNLQEAKPRDKTEATNQDGMESIAITDSVVEAFKKLFVAKALESSECILLFGAYIEKGGMVAEMPFYRIVIQKGGYYERSIAIGELPSLERSEDIFQGIQIDHPELKLGELKPRNDQNTILVCTKEMGIDEYAVLQMEVALKECHVLWQKIEGVRFFGKTLQQFVAQNKPKQSIVQVRVPRNVPLEQLFVAAHDFKLAAECAFASQLRTPHQTLFIYFLKLLDSALLWTKYIPILNNQLEGFYDPNKTRVEAYLDLKNSAYQVTALTAASTEVLGSAKEDPRKGPEQSLKNIIGVLLLEIFGQHTKDNEQKIRRWLDGLNLGELFAAMDMLKDTSTNMCDLPCTVISKLLSESHFEFSAAQHLGPQNEWCTEVLEVLTELLSKNAKSKPDINLFGLSDEALYMMMDGVLLKIGKNGDPSFVLLGPTGPGSIRILSQYLKTADSKLGIDDHGKCDKTLLKLNEKILNAMYESALSVAEFLEPPRFMPLPNILPPGLGHYETYRISLGLTPQEAICLDIQGEKGHIYLYRTGDALVISVYAAGNYAATQVLRDEKTALESLIKLTSEALVDLNCSVPNGLVEHALKALFHENIDKEAGDSLPLGRYIVGCFAGGRNACKALMVGIASLLNPDGRQEAEKMTQGTDARGLAFLKDGPLLMSKVGAQDNSALLEALVGASKVACFPASGVSDAAPFSCYIGPQELVKMATESITGDFSQMGIDNLFPPRETLQPPQIKTYFIPKSFCTHGAQLKGFFGIESFDALRNFFFMTAPFQCLRFAQLFAFLGHPIKNIPAILQTLPCGIEPFRGVQYLRTEQLLALFLSNRALTIPNEKMLRLMGEIDDPQSIISMVSGAVIHPFIRVFIADSGKQKQFVELIREQKALLLRIGELSDDELNALKGTLLALDPTSLDLDPALKTINEQINALPNNDDKELIQELLQTGSRIFKELHFQAKASQPQVVKAKYLTRDALVQHFGECLKSFARSRISSTVGAVFAGVAQGAQAVRGVMQAAGGTFIQGAQALQAARGFLTGVAASAASSLMGAAPAALAIPATAPAPAALAIPATAPAPALNDDDKYNLFVLLAYLLTLQSKFYAAQFANGAALFLGLLDGNAPDTAQFLENVKNVLGVMGQSANVQLLQKLLSAVNEDTSQACEIRSLAQAIFQHSNISEAEIDCWEKLKSDNKPMEEAQTTLSSYWQELKRGNQTASTVISAYQENMSQEVMKRVLLSQADNTSEVDKILRYRIAASPSLMEKAAQYAQDYDASILALNLDKLEQSRVEGLYNSEEGKEKLQYTCAMILAGRGITDPVQLASLNPAFFRSMAIDDSKELLKQVITSVQDREALREKDKAEYMKQQLRNMAAGIDRDLERRDEGFIVLWQTFRNLMPDLFESNLMPLIAKYLEYKVPKPVASVLEKCPHFGLIILSWVIQDPFPISLPDIAIKMQCLVTPEGMKDLQENDLESLRDLMTKAVLMFKQSPEEFMSRVIRAFEVVSKIGVEECSIEDYRKNRADPAFLGSSYEMLDRALVSVQRGIAKVDPAKLFFAKGFDFEYFGKDVQAVQEFNAQFVIDRLSVAGVREKCIAIFGPDGTAAEAEAQNLIKLLKEILPELDNQGIKNLLQDDESEPQQSRLQGLLGFNQPKEWSVKLKEALKCGSRITNLVTNLQGHYKDNFGKVWKFLTAAKVAPLSALTAALTADTILDAIKGRFQSNGEIVAEDGGSSIAAIKSYLVGLGAADLRRFLIFTEPDNFEIYCKKCDKAAEAVLTIRAMQSVQFMNTVFFQLGICSKFGDLAQALYLFDDSVLPDFHRRIILSVKRILFLLEYFKDVNQTEDGRDLEGIASKLRTLLDSQISRITPGEVLGTIPEDLSTQLENMIKKKTDIGLPVEVLEADQYLQEIRNILEAINRRVDGTVGKLYTMAENAKLPPFEYLTRVENVLQSNASMQIRLYKNYLDQIGTDDANEYYSLREALSSLDPFFNAIPKYPCLDDPSACSINAHSLSATVLTKVPQLMHKVWSLIGKGMEWLGVDNHFDQHFPGASTSFAMKGDIPNIPKILHFILNFCTTLFCLDGDPGADLRVTKQRKAILRILFLLKVIATRLWDFMATVILNPDILLNCFSKSGNPEYLKTQYTDMENKLEAFGYGACPTHFCSLIIEEVIGLLALSIRRAASEILDKPASRKSFEFYVYSWLKRIRDEDMITKGLGLAEWHDTSNTETMYNGTLILLERIGTKSAREMAKLCGLLRLGITDEMILPRIELQMYELLKEVLAKIQKEEGPGSPIERLGIFVKNSGEKQEKLDLANDALRLNTICCYLYYCAAQSQRVTGWIPSPEPVSLGLSLRGAVKALFPSKKPISPLLKDLMHVIHSEDLKYPENAAIILSTIQEIEKEEGLGEVNTPRLWKIIELLQREGDLFRMQAAKLYTCITYNGLESGGINPINALMQDLCIWLVSFVFVPSNPNNQALLAIPGTTSSLVAQSLPRFGAPMSLALVEVAKFSIVRILSIFKGHKKEFKGIKAWAHQHFPMLEELALNEALIKESFKQNYPVFAEYFEEFVEKRLEDLLGRSAQEELEGLVGGKGLELLGTVLNIISLFFWIPVLGPMLSVLSIADCPTIYPRVGDPSDLWDRYIGGLLAGFLGYEPNEPRKDLLEGSMRAYVQPKNLMREKHKKSLHDKVPDFPLSNTILFCLLLKFTFQVLESLKGSKKPIESLFVKFFAPLRDDPAKVITYLKANPVIGSLLVQILNGYSDCKTPQEGVEFKKQLSCLLYERDPRFMGELLGLMSSKLGFFSSEKASPTPGLDQHAPRVVSAINKLWSEDLYFKLLQIGVSYHQSPKMRGLELALCADGNRKVDNLEFKAAEFELELKALGLNTALGLWFLTRIVYEALLGTNFIESTADLLGAAFNLNSELRSEEWRNFLQHRRTLGCPTIPCAHDPTYSLMIFHLSRQDAEAALNLGCGILESIKISGKDTQFHRIREYLVGLFVSEKGQDKAKVNFEQFAIQTRMVLGPVAFASILQELGETFAQNQMAASAMDEMFPFGHARLARILPKENFNFTNPLYVIRDAAALSALPNEGLVSGYVESITKLAINEGANIVTEERLKAFDEALNFLMTQNFESAPWPGEINDEMIGDRWPLEKKEWDDGSLPYKRQRLSLIITVGQMIKGMNFTRVSSGRNPIVDDIFKAKMTNHVLADYSPRPEDYVGLYVVFSSANADLNSAIHRIASLADFGLQLGSLPAELVYTGNPDPYHDNAINNAAIKEIILDILRGQAVLFGQGFTFVTEELRYALNVIHISSDRSYPGIARFAAEILNLEPDSKPESTFVRLLSLVQVIEKSEIRFIRGSKFDRGLYAPDLDKADFSLSGIKRAFDGAQKALKDDFDTRLASSRMGLDVFLRNNPKYVTGMRQFFAENRGIFQSTLGPAGEKQIVRFAQLLGRGMHVLSDPFKLFKRQYEARVGECVLTVRPRALKEENRGNKLTVNATLNGIWEALSANLESLKKAGIEVSNDYGTIRLGTDKVLFIINGTAVVIWNPGAGETALHEHFDFLRRLAKALHNKQNSSLLAPLIELIYTCPEVRSIDYRVKNTLSEVSALAKSVSSKAEMEIDEKRQNAVDFGLRRLQGWLVEYGQSILPGDKTIRLLEDHLRDAGNSATNASRPTLFNKLKNKGLLGDVEDLSDSDMNASNLAWAYQAILFSACRNLSNIAPYVPFYDLTITWRMALWTPDEIKKKLNDLDAKKKYNQGLQEFRDANIDSLIKKYTDFATKLEEKYRGKQQPAEIEKLIFECKDLVKKLEAIKEKLDALIQGTETRISLGEIAEEIKGLKLPAAYLSPTFIAPELIDGMLVQSEFGESPMRETVRREARPFIFSGEVWILVSGTGDRELSNWYLLSIRPHFTRETIVQLGRALGMQTNSEESLRKYLANLISMVDIDPMAVKAVVPRDHGSYSLEHIDALYAERISRYIQERQPTDPLAAKTAAYRIIYNMSDRLPVINPTETGVEGVKRIIALDGSTLLLDSRGIPIVPGSGACSQLSNTGRVNKGMSSRTAPDWRYNFKAKIKGIETLLADGIQWTIEIEFVLVDLILLKSSCQINAKVTSNRKLAASIKIDFQPDNVGVYILEMPQSLIGSKSTLSIILQFINEAHSQLNRVNNIIMSNKNSDISEEDRKSVAYWVTALAQNKEMLESFRESALGIDLLTGGSRVITVRDPAHLQQYFWTIAGELARATIQLDPRQLCATLEKLMPRYISTKRFSQEGDTYATCVLLTQRVGVGLGPIGGLTMSWFTCVDSTDFRRITPPAGSNLNTNQMMALTAPRPSPEEITFTEQSWSKAVAMIVLSIVITGICLCLIFIFMNMIITTHTIEGDETVDFALVACKASLELLEEFGHSQEFTKTLPKLEADSLIRFTIFIPEGA